jgi:hypothetical protein
MVIKSEGFTKIQGFSKINSLVLVMMMRTFNHAKKIMKIAENYKRNHFNNIN